MFFVGGNNAGGKAENTANDSGVALAGGCTKAWWDAEVAATSVAAAMSKLMGDDGETLADYACYVREGNGGNARLDTLGVTPFGSTEVGMLVYFSDSDGALSGAGVYKIVEVDPSSRWIDIDAQYFGDSASADMPYVGGAWNDIATPLNSYVSALSYTQEIWVNKDLAPTVQWDWSFCRGDRYHNTWLVLKGFNEIPGDITETSGEYFQTAKDMFDNGADADSLVELDTSGMGIDFIDTEDAQNIIMSGFSGLGHATYEYFEDITNPAYNIELSHNAFDVTAYWRLDNHNDIVFLDNFITTSNAYQTLFEFPSGENSVFINNYIEYDNKIGNGAPAFAAGNIVKQLGAGTPPMYFAYGVDSSTVSLNNTYLNNDGSYGVFRTNNGAIAWSYNDLFMNADTDIPVFGVGKFGGSFRVRNACAYSYMGALDDVQKLETVGVTEPIRLSDMDNVIEVDPLLDADNLPRNKSLRLTNHFGQYAWIGASNVNTDLPELANVLTIDTVDDVAGTYQRALEANVEAGVTYGDGGSEFTGTLEGLTPPEPTGDVTPAGETGKAMAALKDMIAESTTFQDAIGAVGDAAAKKLWALSRIPLAEYPSDEDFESEGGFERPFALIVTPGGDLDSAISDGSFGHGGELEIWLEQTIGEAYQADGQEHNAEMYFKNFVDGVVTDCQALSAKAGYLITSRWLRPDGPGRIDVKNIKAYAEKISVSWGLL